MKKTLVALAVSGLAVAAVNAAPTAGSFYVGAKAGWANIHNDVNQLNSKYANDVRYGKGDAIWNTRRNSLTYGVFGGYQIANHLALELGYDHFTQTKDRHDVSKPKPSWNSNAIGSSSNVTQKRSAHGAHLSLKPSYEVLSGLDVYAKVGMAVARSDYKLEAREAKNVTYTERYHTLKSSLLLGAGFEYAITPSFAVRAEYQLLRQVGDQKKAAAKRNIRLPYSYRPDIHSVSVGLSYRFGQGAKPTAPEVVTKNFAFSSDVLFDFAKADLKPAAAAKLDETYTEISSLGLASPAVQVSGYTDRIGKDAPNLALSQRRAESVANYIVSKGVNPANFTAVGYGEANPVTGNTCDAVKGRQALIACLAPDRRVEVQVQGSKEVVM